MDFARRIKRDAGQVGASLDRLADQLRDGWRQARGVKLPPAYRRIKNIALCGMGGSHLGGDILRTALSKQLRIPLTIVADYNLPAWVGRETLVVCSSYSGTTEETLAAAKTAEKRRAKIVVITSGGPLAKHAKRRHLPLYLYQPTENPSGQPRLGVAYGMMALLRCFRKLGLIKISDQEADRLPVIAWEATKRFQIGPRGGNATQSLALSWVKRIPLLIGGDWTAGNLHTFHNQINENAKTFCAWFLLPDLNHHLLEGLRRRTVTKQIHVLMILDSTYHKRTQLRFAITAKILKQLGAKVSTYKPRGATTLEKAIDMLAFGGYASWYLAAYRKVLPAPIPTVNRLKAELRKSS